MKMFLGLLAMLYACFLPGYLAVRSFRLQLGGAATLVFAFCISLLINYCTVVVLVALGLYTPWLLRVLFVVVIAALLWVERRHLAEPIASLVSRCSVAAKTSLRGFVYGGGPALAVRIARATLLMLAMLVIFYYALRGVLSFGTIFHIWDDVVSWNHWATQWAANRFPHATYHYPQLLPALFSLTYVFLGDTKLQFFAKGIMPLFVPAILMALLSLALRTRKIDYALGVIACATLLTGLMEPFFFEGYADIPVAFMATAAICAVLLAREEEQAGRRRTIVWIGAIAAIGAAQTKQVGLLIAACYPVLVLLASRPETLRFSRSDLAFSAKVAGVIGVLSLPWYVFAQIQVLLATNASELYHLFVLEHGERGAYERIAHAYALLSRILSPTALIAAMVGPLLALRDSAWRPVMLLVVVPFAIAWALFFSYDQRNLTMVVPLIGAGIGVGVGSLIRFHAHIVTSLARLSGKLPVAVCLGAIALAVVGVLSTRYDDRRLLARQLFLQRTIGEDEVNAAVYAAYGELPGKIVTNYTMLAGGFLPGLEEAAVPFEFENSESLQLIIESVGATYILARTDTLAGSDVPLFLESRIRTGDYRLLFRKSVGRNFLFVRVLARERG